VYMRARRATWQAYPLDLVRTRLAAQTGVSRQHYQGISHAFRTIIAHDGLPGLYRGLKPTLLQAGPNLALNYCAYEGFRSRWLADHPANSTPPVHVSLVCGSLAGMASSTVTFPLDVIRRRMQMQGAAGSRMRYSGVMNAISTVFRHEGLRGFYAGIVPEYIKVAPGVAITYCTYEAMKLLLLGDDFNARR
jgi:solute carrier family 25 phosphate transporter 23/24/25/41